MEVGVLYKLKRGNQTQNVGLVIKGATASVQVLGLNGMPATQDDMVDMTDAQLLDEGAWPFAMLPQYVLFVGTADNIEIVGMGYDVVPFPSTWGD